MMFLQLMGVCMALSGLLRTLQGEYEAAAIFWLACAVFSVGARYVGD